MKQDVLECVPWTSCC